ncbi:MAG: trypsin-like peptidase domain-containing protein [Acidobacteria bacterium]|nr:trypsin-like peptidase domain-containing protein [Acidobacteriota bacterium]
MLRRPTLSLLLVIAAFAAGLFLSGRVHLADETGAAPALIGRAAAASDAPGATAQASTPATVPAGLPDFSGIATRAVSGVVNISSLQEVRAPNSPFASDPFFRYFFGDDEELFGSRSRRSLSLGSGVIVSSDGYIVTNSHVVGDNVREISAVLPDKREVRGKIIGSDQMTDIAVVKITATGLPTVPWGDSSKLKAGQWVLAIGSPFQLNQTVTLGIVSAVGRANVGVADYEDFIQTDAAINPGNSGGALIDARGDLIGINTAIYSQSGGYQGVGFAVPSNLARRVFDELVKYGEVRRGSIGVIEVSTLTTQLAGQLGVGDTRGTVVTRMYRSSPAYQAGLRPGDVVVAFNGRRVEDAGQLLRLVADAKVGGTAAVSIIRIGKKMELRIPVEQGSRRTAR